MHQEHWEIDLPTWRLVDIQLYLLSHNSVQIAIKLWGFQLYALMRSLAIVFVPICLCIMASRWRLGWVLMGQHIDLWLLNDEPVSPSCWRLLVVCWGRSYYSSLSLQFSIWVITVCPHSTLRFFFWFFFKKTLKTRLSCRRGEESTRAAWVNWWPLGCVSFSVAIVCMCC